MPTDLQHGDNLAKLADRHQQRLAESLITLENRIVDLMATAPLKDGNFFDLEWAISARNEIRQLVDAEYLSQIDSILRDYPEVAADAQSMLKRYGDFTKIDPEIITQLQTLEFQGFSDIGAEYTDAISKEVYQNTLTGRSFADSVNSIKQVAGGDLARYANQQVHDSLMQFDATINVAIGKEAGATRWKYVGSLIETSRQFCKDHEGEVMDDERIEQLWNTSWAGKASGDPFIVRGGYNCGHRFRPVFNEEIAEIEKEEEEPQQTQGAFPKAETGLPKPWNDLANSDGGIRPEAAKIIAGLDKPEIKASRSRAFYNSGTKSISTYKKDKSVFLHEYGHHIDYDLGGSATSTVSEAFFPDAAKLDAKKLGVFQQFKETLSPLQKQRSRDAAVISRVKELRDELMETVPYIPKSGKWKGITRGTTSVPKFPGADLISDIIDSMSQGAMYDEARGFGHGGNYFMGRNAIKFQQTENFANMFSLWSQDGEGWDKAQELFPKLTEEFLDIVGEFG